MQEKVNVGIPGFMLLEHYEVAKAMPRFAEPFPELLDFALSFVANGREPCIAYPSVDFDDALAPATEVRTTFCRKPVGLRRLGLGHSTLKQFRLEFRSERERSEPRAASS